MFWDFVPGFSVLELAGAISLWFFCGLTRFAPALSTSLKIVLTRQHPFQHPQHHELDLLGWVEGGFRLARVGSWWVPGLFKASSGVAALNY